MERTQVADAYLNIAESVLLQSRRPMTPVEILRQAYSQDLMPWHLHGRTQHKTMQARLSEDIAAHREESRFFRTAPGRFFIRALLDDPQTPEAYRVEFPAPPRRKELKRDAILAVPGDILLSGDNSGRISVFEIKRCFEAGRHLYRHWTALNNQGEYTPVHSFVVVHRNDQILSFRTGKFTERSDPLLGKRSIGFGGTVLFGDTDFLYDSFYGVIGNVINELVCGIGLPRRLAESARYKNEVRPHFGITAGMDRLFLYIILSYRCPDEFSPTKSALSLNDLRWVWSGNPANSLGSYDSVSRILFEHGWVEELTSSA
jgi:hypothetical protein